MHTLMTNCPRLSLKISKLMLWLFLHLVTTTDWVKRQKQTVTEVRWKGNKRNGCKLPRDQKHELYNTVKQSETLMCVCVLNIRSSFRQRWSPRVSSWSGWFQVCAQRPGGWPALEGRWRRDSPGWPASGRRTPPSPLW